MINLSLPMQSITREMRLKNCSWTEDFNKFEFITVTDTVGP